MKKKNRSAIQILKQTLLSLLFPLFTIPHWHSRTFKNELSQLSLHPLPLLFLVLILPGIIHVDVTMQRNKPAQGSCDSIRNFHLSASDHVLSTRLSTRIYNLLIRKCLFIATKSRKEKKRKPMLYSNRSKDKYRMVIEDNISFAVWIFSAALGEVWSCKSDVSVRIPIHMVNQRCQIIRFELECERHMSAFCFI